MALNRIVITEKPRKGKETKTRSFSQDLVGYLACEALFEGGAETWAPLWLSYVGSPQEAKAFTANLRSGARAVVHSATLQLPRSAGYRFLTRPLPGRAVATVAYLPAFLDLDPATPFCDDVSFLFVVPRWWIDAREEELSATFGDEAREAACASLFAAYVDRRSPFPVLPDPRFHLRLYRAAQEEPWCCGREDLSLPGAALVDPALLEALLVVRVDHEAFADFLSGVVRTYYREEISHGPSRFSDDRWLLPHTAPIVEQLSFAFGVA
ncbi:MAG: hypothetical protein KDD47_10090 [Acidobacteria bacterium]|nr:hypothetical protein [Acidobacteriota bacterium]